MSIHTLQNDLVAKLFSSAVMGVSLGMITISFAHAEQYCKSVDKSGNATYTLAPEKGCNTKKFKTVAVKHYNAPTPVASAPTPTATAVPATNTAPTTATTSGQTHPTPNTADTPITAAPTQHQNIAK